MVITAIDGLYVHLVPNISDYRLSTKVIDCLFVCLSLFGDRITFFYSETYYTITAMPMIDVGLGKWMSAPGRARVGDG